MRDSSKSLSFPDPFVSNEAKQSVDYGLEYAKFIESEWITGGTLASRRKKFEELEAYKDNSVDIDKFKSMLNIPKDKAYLSLNWEFTSIVPKFINVVKDSFPVDMFKVVAKGVDIMSQKERQSYRKNLETEMLTRDFTSEMSAATGINFMPEYVPDSKEELDLHMQLKYKQDKEIATEVIINRVFDVNYFREIQNRVAEDLVTNGFAALRVETDPNYGVLIRHVDGKRMMYSYDTLKTRDKKGCYYFGELLQMTVEEIYRKSNGYVTKEMLKKATPDRRFNDRREYDDDDTLTVMYFTFKTTFEEVYKRKRNNLIRKERDFKLPEQSSSRIVRGSYDVWFEGYYILGTNTVFNYRLMKDMIRPVNDSNVVMSPYIVYELTTPSLVENMKPFADDVHLTVLKLRHLISKLRPDGYQIDIDGLTNINIGTGSTLSPAEIIQIYDQTGNLLVKSSGFDDEAILRGNIMQVIPTTDGAKLAQLINTYNHNLNMCYEVTGVNRVRDGSAPLNGALVGTQQMALTMSNTATKYILEGLLSMKKNASEVILNRAQQMSMYHENFADDIMSYLLDDNTINSYMSLYKYKLDVVIELKPDAEEKNKFEQTVLAAIQAGQITLADRIDIMSIDNLKMASSYLKIVMKKRQDEAVMRQKEMEAARIQAEAQAQMAIEQQKQQSLMIELQAKSNELQVKNQADIRLHREKVEGEIMLENLKHQHRMRELGLQADVTAQATKYKEDKKDERTYKQAQQQSELINQRQNGGSPIPFESMSQQEQAQSAPPVEIPPMDEVNEQLNYNDNGTTEEAGQAV